MGSQSKKMNMRIILLFTIIGSSLAFSIDLDRALALPRSLCCLTINAQTTCATQCSGKSCSATCTVRCGILMSTCGTYTCSAVAASTCTTTAAQQPQQLQQQLQQQQQQQQLLVSIPELPVPPPRTLAVLQDKLVKHLLEVQSTVYLLPPELTGFSMAT